MNDVSRTGWGVRLGGHQSDLALWEQALKAPFEPCWIERYDEEVVLRSLQFEHLPDPAEVRGRAVSLVERLNGAMKISVGSRPVHLESVIEFRADGSRHGIVFIDAVSLVGGGAVIAAPMLIPSDGKVTPPEPPKPSEVQQWVRLSGRHDELADALIYFGRGEWFDVYKAIECLEDWVGGERALRAKNWMDPEELKRLKQTANSFRHRRGGKDTPPPRSFKLDEALEALAVLIRCAFESLQGEGHSR
jgi:hypothetical protein